MTPFTDIDAKYGLPAGTMSAVMKIESGGNPNAVSPKGAEGKFQVEPATQKNPGYGVTPFSGNDPNGAAQYLAAMKDKFGSLPAALAAYNWGPGNLEKYGMDKIPPETQNYIQKVTDSLPQTTAQNAPPAAMMQMLQDRANQKDEPSSGFQNAMQLLQQRASGKAIQLAAAPKMPAPSALSSFEQGLRDPIDAGAQMLVHALPSGAINAVNSATQYVNNLPVIGPITKELGMTPATTKQIDTGIAKTNAKYGQSLPRTLGNITTTLPLFYGMPAASGLLGNIGTGIASGALGGSLNPVTNQNGNFLNQKLKQVGIGAAAGGALAPVAGAVSRIVRPNTNPAVKTLMSQGITPTPGQIVGGATQWLEDKLTSVPAVGDLITNARKSGLDEFNKAIYNKALAPIGEKSTQPVGREGVSEVSQKLSNAYDKILPKLTFKADPEFHADLSKISHMVSTLPEAEASQFNKILQTNVLGKLTPDGLASGETVKTIESDLGRMASGYRSDPSFDKRQLGNALAEVQTSIRSTLARANPQAAKQLANINKGYSTYSILRNAAARQGSKQGVVTPGQFSGAVRQADKSVGKGNFARGNARLQDLSDAAKGVLMNQYPDSGTMGRGLLYWLATGGLHFVSPHAAIGAGLGGLAYLPGGRQLAAGLLTSRPAFAKPLAAGVRRLLPAAGGLLAPQLTSP